MALSFLERQRLWEQANISMGSIKTPNGTGFRNPNGAAVRAEYERLLAGGASKPKPTQAQIDKNTKIINDMRANNSSQEDIKKYVEGVQNRGGVASIGKPVQIPEVKPIEATKDNTYGGVVAEARTPEGERITPTVSKTSEGGLNVDFSKPQKTTVANTNTTATPTLEADPYQPLIYNRQTAVNNRSLKIGSGYKRPMNRGGTTGFKRMVINKSLTV